MTMQHWMVIASEYKVSGDQSELEVNQIRLYKDVDEVNRIYIVVTVEEE